MSIDLTQKISVILAGLDSRMAAAEAGASPIRSSLIVQIGDSIGAGTATDGYTAITNLGFDPALVTINNQYSVSGRTLAQMSGDLPNGLSALYDPAKRCIAIIQRVTNDLGNDQRAAADAWALEKEQISRFQAQGFYVGVVTPTPRSVGSYAWTNYSETQRQTILSLMRNNAPGSGFNGADFLIDVAADATMGASGAPANTSLYKDGTHPTNGGQDIITPIYKSAITPWLKVSPRVPAPSVSISAAQSKNEGNSGATLYTYTVTRTQTATAITVPYTFAAGATDASDYTGGALPVNGTLAFAVGEATKTITISVSGDTTIEQNEIFTITLQAGSGYSLGSPNSATGTIVDDDTSTAKTPQTIFGSALVFWADFRDSSTHSYDSNSKLQTITDKIAGLAITQSDASKRFAMSATGFAGGKAALFSATSTMTFTQPANFPKGSEAGCLIAGGTETSGPSYPTVFAYGAPSDRQNRALAASSDVVGAAYFNSDHASTFAWKGVERKVAAVAVSAGANPTSTIWVDGQTPQTKALSGTLATPSGTTVLMNNISYPVIGPMGYLMVLNVVPTDQQIADLATYMATPLS